MSSPVSHIRDGAEKECVSSKVPQSEEVALLVTPGTPPDTSSVSKSQSFLQGLDKTSIGPDQVIARGQSPSVTSKSLRAIEDEISVTSSSDEGGLGSSHETLEVHSTHIQNVPGASPIKTDPDIFPSLQQTTTTSNMFSQQHIPSSRHHSVHLMDKFRDVMRSRSVRFRSSDFLKNLFPCIGFARQYTPHHFVSDCIAGLTLALTVIPMGIGYAELAQLPIQYGLYASIVPGFAYALFGTCKEVTIGPTAVNALMSSSYAGPSVRGALTLGFFCGIIEMGAGILNLGFLTNFISAPVIAAFTSAVSINVMTSQIKGLLGLSEVEGRGFRNTWLAVFQNIQQVKPVDATIGFTSLGVILLLRNFRNFTFCRDTDTSRRRGRYLEKLKWFVTVSRNSIVLIVSSLIAYVLKEVCDMKDSVDTTGDVPAGIPAWNLPWRFNSTKSEEDTGPIELANGFGMGLLMLPLVSMIQIIAIVQNFSPPTKSINASQEILALGVCQFVGSFAGSLPITASFGRSTVNRASGVKTPFGGIVTGLIVIAACLFLTPHFAYIPKAALAAVIISSVVLTIDVEILLPIWKSKKIDIVPYLVTFVVGVFVKVELGMICGTLTHICILLYSSSQPNLLIQMDKIEGVAFVMVQPDRALNFPAVDRIRTKLMSLQQLKSEEDEAVVSNQEEKDGQCQQPGGTPLPVVFDLQRVVEMDFAAGAAVRALAKNMSSSSGQVVAFCGASQSVEDVLQGVDPSLFISHPNVTEAVKCCARV